MVDVSICIVNYNAKDFLDNCIRSIFGSIKDRSYEVIVVDNASTDGSREIAKKYPSIRYIQNPSNLGFIKANNIGIKSSGGRYVLSLNNDTVIKNGAIEKMVDFMDKTSDAGAVGPKLLNSDGSIQMQCRRGFPTPSSSLFYFLGLSRLFPKSKIFRGLSSDLS